MDRQYDVNLQCGATRFRVNEIVAILKELLKQVGELVRDNLSISRRRYILSFIGSAINFAIFLPSSFVG